MAQWVFPGGLGQVISRKALDKHSLGIGNDCMLPHSPTQHTRCALPIYSITTGLLICLGLACTPTAQPPARTGWNSKGDLLLARVNVFTGLASEPVRMDVDVLIRDGKIAEISSERLPKGNATVVRGGGKKFVLPAFIDSHIHLLASGGPPPPMDFIQGDADTNAQAFLAAGVTTVVDLLGYPSSLAEWQKSAAEINSPRPKLYFAGKGITAAGGHPAAMIRANLPFILEDILVDRFAYEYSSLDDPVDEWLAENKQAGASLVKIIIDEIPLQVPRLNAQQIEKVVKGAEQIGQPVIAHVGSDADVRRALKAGVRFFAHAPYQDLLTENTLKKMGAAKAVMLPTTVVFDSVVRYNQSDMPFSKFETKLMAKKVMDAYAQGVAKPQKGSDNFKEWTQLITKRRKMKFTNVIRMREAGVEIIAASDSPNVGVGPGGSLHREMQLLVENCGFTPAEAVEAATFRPAKFIQKYIDSKAGAGRLNEGNRADIVILNSDFREDITRTTDIYRVILNGRLVKRRFVAKVQAQ